MKNNIFFFIKNQYVFSIINKIFIMGIGLLTSIISARYLGNTLKGFSSYVSSLIGIFSIIMTFGVHQAYPYLLKKNADKNYLSIFMNQVVFLFIGMIFLVALSLIFMRDINVFLVATFSLVYAYARISGYVYLIEDANKRNMALSLISVVELIYIVVLFLFTTSNSFYALSILVIFELIKCCYFTKRLDFRINILEVKFIELGKILKLGILPMIALLLTSLNYRIDVIMLKGFDNISLADIGVYSIGMQLAEKSLLISDAVKEILLSKLSNGKATEEVNKTMRICFPINLLIAILMGIFGEYIINILYGSEYFGADTVTTISVYGTCFMVYFKMISTYYISIGYQKINIVILSISIVLNLVLNSFTIPNYGIIGAAYSTTLSYMICSLIFIIHYFKFTGSKFQDILLTHKDLLIISSVFKSNKRRK